MMKRSFSFAMLLASALTSISNADEIKAHCFDTHTALWTKATLATSVDEPGFDLKVAPQMQFDKSTILERGKWAWQLLTNPTEAVKRKKFYVYDVAAMSSRDIGKLAAFNRRLNDEHSESLRLAFLALEKSTTDFTGLPTKFTGELVWSLAATKGESDIDLFWNEHDLPDESKPEIASIKKDKIIDNTQIFRNIWSDSSEKTVKIGVCDRERLRGANNVHTWHYYSFQSFIDSESLASIFEYNNTLVGLDHEIPELSGFKITEVISRPLQTPDYGTVGWAVEGEVGQSSGVAIKF